MPDVYICLSGVPVWLELKIVKNNRVSVSKSQIAWHLAHTRCKGASFFLLHEPLTGDVFLFGGDKVLELQGSGLDDLRPAALYIGKMDGLACALRPAALDMWGW